MYIVISLGASPFTTGATWLTMKLWFLLNLPVAIHHLQSQHGPDNKVSMVTVVAQPQPLAVISTPVVYNKDDLAPHSFMALAIIVAIFCGVVSLLTLVCSI